MCSREKHEASFENTDIEACVVRKEEIPICFDFMDAGARYCRFVRSFSTLVVSSLCGGWGPWKMEGINEWMRI